MPNAQSSALLHTRQTFTRENAQEHCNVSCNSEQVSGVKAGISTHWQVPSLWYQSCVKLVMTKYKWVLTDKLDNSFTGEQGPKFTFFPP